MKRKIIATIIIVCLLFGCIWIYNRCFAYAVHYNLGNKYYQEYSYLSAMEQYEKALGKNIPKEKECSIRINMALTMMATLGADYAQPDKVDNSIMILEGAKNQLLADNCATEDGTGHHAKAQQLAEEIDVILEQLYKQKGSSDGNDVEKESGDEKESEEMDAKEQSIREEIAQMQEKANMDRETDRQFMKEYDLEKVFEYEGDIW